VEVLPRLDPPPLDGLDLPEDFKRWLSNTIDTLNEALTIIEANLP
jgi:hypothetical protein